MNQLRNEFNIPEDISYLNCAYMAPQLKKVSEVGKNALLRKEQPWNIGPEDFFTTIEKLRSNLATLLHCSADNIALVPSASYGLATAASFYDLNQGDKIVLLEEQFPSNVYIWRHIAQKYNASIIYIKRESEHELTDAVINQSPKDTKIFALPPCHWTDGAKLDIAKLKSTFKDAAFVIDGSQFVGANVFKPQELGVDALVSVGYKWLLGPYALGMMYVADKHLDKMPLEFNWKNYADCRNFANLTNYRDEFAPGARRFDMGEKANFIMAPMFNTAIEWLLELGVENVSAHNSQLLSYLEDQITGIGGQMLPAALRSDHMAGIYFDGVDLVILQSKLQQAHISVSTRGSVIRVSPHLYNDEQDIDSLVQCLKKFKY